MQKQAKWLDITIGKFELTEWHRIAEEWFKEKPRNSDQVRLMNSEIHLWHKLRGRKGGRGRRERERERNSSTNHMNITHIDTPLLVIII